MHAIATPVPAAATRAPMRMIDTTAGMKARAGVLRAASRHSATRGAFRCTACGGRCEVTDVEYDAAGGVVHSKGQCRTPDCIAWEE